jgi:hypothetical protein
MSLKLMKDLHTLIYKGHVNLGICLLFFFHYRAFLKVEYKRTIAHAGCDNKAKVQKIFTAYLNKIILLLKKITGAS